MIPDLSLILNLHDETHYLARTLRSTEEAARFAAASGISTELVIVLDRPAAQTQEWVDRYRAGCFAAIRSVVVNNGSLGPSRADGIAIAQGEYFVLADGDDLISFNMFVGLMQTARSAGPDVIVIPEYSFQFGEGYAVVGYFGHPQIGPLQILFAHPFVSRIMMRRDRFPGSGFRDLPLSAGYAYEDWHFNSDALARGMRIVTAPGTILFYRKRRTSLSAGSTRISVGHIPPTLLANPEILLPIAAADYADWESGSGRQRRQNLVENAAPLIGNFVSSTICRELVAAANRIDPAVDMRRYDGQQIWSNVFEPTVPGYAYYRICEAIGPRRFTDVFLLPYLARGGAEKYLLNIMSGLAELYPDTSILVLTGERVDGHSWLERLPPGTAFIDLCQIAPESSDGDLELLTLKLMQATAPDARIHLKHCVFAYRFWDRFARVLSKANRAILYRFLDPQYTVEQRRFLGGYEFDFISNHMETLHRIVADHQQIIDADRQRFDHRQERWCWLPTECRTMRSAEQIGARGGGWRGRLLWASRLDEQKRPHLLPQLAAALRRRGLQVGIDVYGAPLLQEFDPAELSCDGLDYRGAFDAFDELDCDAYDGFIYTAEFDGLPNVVLEALGAGLPVIAPDIGGLAEVVLPNQTGWLVPSHGSEPALVDGFCEAICQLYEDAERRRGMALAAVELIASRHGRAMFLRRLRHVFGERRW